jgi:hypothetical protein
MFRAAHRSSSGPLNCICSFWFIYPCGDRPLSSLDNGRSPYRHINQRLQIQFRAPDDERCASWKMLNLQKIWNNKFYYKAASCWYFYRVTSQMLSVSWIIVLRTKRHCPVGKFTASYSNDPEFRSLVWYGLHLLVMLSMFLSPPRNSQDIPSNWAKIASFQK